MKEYPEVYEEMTLIALEREKRVLGAKQVALDEYEATNRFLGIESPYRKFKEQQ